MQDEYPQYLKLQAPCGSYNLVITVNLSTNTNSKMHLASSASNFKWELKNTFSFWYFFLSVQLKSFLLTCRKKKKVIIKKNTQIFPTATIQPRGGGHHSSSYLKGRERNTDRVGLKNTLESCKLTCSAWVSGTFCGWRLVLYKLWALGASVEDGKATQPRSYPWD